MSKARHHSMYCAPFGRTIYIATTPKQWRRLRKDFDGALAEDPGVGRTETLTMGNGTEPTFFVWVDAEADDVKRTPLLVVAHEAAHVARFLLNEIGETDPTHEVHAYLTGWVAQGIWDALRSGA